MESKSTHAYLVKVKIILLGGGEVVAIDAIEAGSAIEAESVVVNGILLAEDSATNIGGVTIFPGVSASVTAETIGVIDLSHEENKKWLYSIEGWKTFERNLLQGVKKKKRDDAPLFNEEPPR